MDNTTFSFSFELKCYPVSFIEKYELENGDKIILPPSILESLMAEEIEWPLMFQMKNDTSGRVSHCGVLEFIADEGCAYLPYWMMQNLAATEGDKISFKYKHLDKGTFVRIQPQTFDFLDITNTKAVLELKLRSFTCLSKSDSIAINYNNKIYWLNVVEVKPGNAISIVEADVNVDFIAPLMPETPKKTMTDDDNGKNFLDTESSTQN